MTFSGILQIFDRFSIDFRQIFDRFSIDFRGLGGDQRRPRCAPSMGIQCGPHGKMIFFFAKIAFFSLGALKLLANHEKQLLTFFGFLPPYFGVLRSLAQPMGLDLTRSIAPYQKFFISLHLARFSKNRYIFDRFSIDFRQIFDSGLGQYHQAPLSGRTRTTHSNRTRTLGAVRGGVATKAAKVEEGSPTNVQSLNADQGESPPLELHA